MIVYIKLLTIKRYNYIIFSFFISLLFQLLAFEIFFNFDVNNVYSYFNDTKIYHDSLLNLNLKLRENYNLFYLLDYPFLNYAHLFIYHLISLIFDDNFIFYFIFNSLIIVGIYLLLVRLSEFLIDNFNNYKFIIFFLIIFNPLTYYYAIMMGKELIFLFVILYIFFFIFYNNNNCFFLFSRKNLNL